MEQKQQQNVNMDPSIKPIFADEVAVACSIKQDKDENGKISKEGNLSLIFLDALGQRAVARVTISKTTAKALSNILKTNTDQLEKELQKKGELKKPVVMQKTAEKDNYIG